MLAWRSGPRARSPPPAPAGADMGMVSSPLPQPKSAVADFGHFVEWPNPRYSEVRLGRGRGGGPREAARHHHNLPTPYPNPPPQGGRESRRLGCSLTWHYYI